MNQDEIRTFLDSFKAKAALAPGDVAPQIGACYDYWKLPVITYPDKDMRPIARGLIDPLWKLPPIAKVFEALSAVADGRVNQTGDQRAAVQSSDSTKTYTIEWNSDVTQITSNDNASYYQGYIGYPIIAVLLVLGKIPYSSQIAANLKGIPWKKLNKQHKSNYDHAVEASLQELQANGVDTQAIRDEAQEIFTKLGALGLKKLVEKRQPPPVS